MLAVRAEIDAGIRRAVTPRPRRARTCAVVTAQVALTLNVAAAAVIVVAEKVDTHRATLLVAIVAYALRIDTGGVIRAFGIMCAAVQDGIFLALVVVDVISGFTKLCLTGAIDAYDTVEVFDVAGMAVFAAVVFVIGFA